MGPGGGADARRGRPRQRPHIRPSPGAHSRAQPHPRRPRQRLVGSAHRRTRPRGSRCVQTASLRPCGANHTSWSQLRLVPRLFHTSKIRAIQLAWRSGFVTAARIRGPDERVAPPVASTARVPGLLAAHSVWTSPATISIAATRGLRDAARLADMNGLRMRASRSARRSDRWALGWLRESAPNLRRTGDRTTAIFAGLPTRDCGPLQCAGHARRPGARRPRRS